MLKPVAGIVVCFACLCAHGAVAETSAVSHARGERLFVGVTDVCRTPEDVQVQRFYIEALAAAGHVPGFRISAFAPDGVPEAIEGDSYPAAGLQFHPEAILAASKDPQFDRERLMKIFARLGELVSVYGIILCQ